MDPFVFHEEAARAWLTELVVAYEVDASFGGDASVHSADSPPIGMAWDPQQLGEEDGVSLLVKAAQGTGMVGRPEGMTVTFEFVGDGDEGVYRWLLDILDPSPLKVATLSESMAVLGEPDLHQAGIEAAVAILREAVQAANHLVHQLSDYVEASIERGGN
ncbi:hypothetical protein [Streptomyces phaeochromogenes]|uniref:hypothetical protein n=1 Tax=Streptomyces phaeochromogenes TaxID=1923 RepID=UPI0038672283|nr:hypothetical protein OG277_38450 [Streptomyces phaeochromogenes]